MFLLVVLEAGHKQGLFQLHGCKAPSVKAMTDLKEMVESGLNGVNQQLADQDLTPFRTTLKDFFIRFEDGCEKLTKGLEVLKQGPPAKSAAEKVEQITRVKTTSICEEVGLLKGQGSQLHKDGHGLMKSLEKKMEHQSAVIDGLAASVAQMGPRLGGHMGQLREAQDEVLQLRKEADLFARWWLGMRSGPSQVDFTQTLTVEQTGEYNLCWCRQYSTEMACNLPDHWRLVGDITVICTGDSYDNNGVCDECGLPWNGPNEDKTRCEMYADRALAIILMNLFYIMAFFLLSLQLEVTHPDRARPLANQEVHWFQGKTGWRLSGRRVLIEDISVEGEGNHLVVTTLGSHFLRVGTTFRVHFTETNHYLLDGQYKRATVVDGSRLDLHNLDGTFFAADASG
ncbi:unnamed protein product, partial [Symbiodinium microadriaticum]